MSAILLEITNGVGKILFNRTEKFNSFNREMALQLQAVLEECEQNDTIRCIYITGNGKAFCAGQDLGEVTGDLPAVSFDKILKEHYNPIISKIRNIPKPVVCAVNGVAAGAGANIALCCDIVVAHEQASFIQAFSKIGLIPDCGGTYFLPRLIGFQKASALMMMGDKISAQEAERLGMIYKYFSADTFSEASLQIAESLSKAATKGIAFTKMALNQSLQNNLEQQLQIEDHWQWQASQTKDFKEGINAFLEKRTPNFNGH
jgi:2-(1,2-epoxy-1,2-dihydrophenyl)acetyl-CoA isomerase